MVFRKKNANTARTIRTITTKAMIPKIPMIPSFPRNPSERPFKTGMLNILPLKIFLIYILTNYINNYILLILFYMDAYYPSNLIGRF